MKQINIQPTATKSKRKYSILLYLIKEWIGGSIFPHKDEKNTITN